MRSIMLETTEPSISVPQHFETRMGKRRWLERTSRVQKDRASLARQSATTTDTTAATFPAAGSPRPTIVEVDE